MFNNLRELILSMPTEKACREYLAKQRWVDGKASCPYCGHGKCYSIEDGERYKCANNKCYKRFKITVGTIFEASNIPLSKWFTAIYLVTAHKKGISSYQLGKDIVVVQKSAWFMLHRVREMLRLKHDVKLDNIVEIDEVYIGGKVGNMSKTKRKKLRDEGNTYNTKTMVVGMIERSGNLKLIHFGKTTNMSSLQPLIRQNVDKDAVVITDSLGSYTGLNNHFAGHEIVNHSEQEYVRDGGIHTNSIEGAFSLLRRSIYGIYHQVTPKHLDRYCDETMFRYNLRGMKDADRFSYSLTNVEGRLTYKALVEATAPVQSQVKNIPNKGKQGRKRPVLQIQDGEVIACHGSIVEAAKAVKVDESNIRRVLDGKSNTAGGFNWNYA